MHQQKLVLLQRSMLLNLGSPMACPMCFFEEMFPIDTFCEMLCNNVPLDIMHHADLGNDTEDPRKLTWSGLILGLKGDWKSPATCYITAYVRVQKGK